MALRERISDPNIGRVYAATLASSVGFGMAISLLPVYLHQRGFDKTTVGSLAAWFASGIVLLALPMGRLVQRFSAKTTLATAFAGYSVVVSLFPYLDAYGAIATVRMIDGACSVGVWMSAEIILLSRAGPTNKAFVTSLYAVMMGLGYVIGPFIARALVVVMPFRSIFVISGAIAFVCSLYVGFKIDRDPPERAPHDHPEHATTPAGSRWAILWRIKNSCYATFSFGYFVSSVVLFLPIFVIEQKGVSENQTILIPAFFAAGMLLFSNVVGRLGDRHGHLGVMRVLAVIGTTMILSFLFLDSYLIMLAAVFVAGATLATISPLSLALQGVVIHHSDYPRANALYNAFYAAGMLLGPPISSAIFSRFGGGPMLYHLAALWTGFVGFSIYFHKDDPAAARLRAAKSPVAAE